MQRVLEGDELRNAVVDAVVKTARRLSVTNEFAAEKVPSMYGYPEEYHGPRLIIEQVDVLAKLFNLSLGATLEFIAKTRLITALPKFAEGWFAIPSIDALAARFFPEVKDPAERYCRAVNLVLEMLGKSRKSTNYHEGQLTPNRFRQHVRTVEALATISETQPGDILIVPAQFGIRHRGKSVRRARETFIGSEFGIGAFGVGCMTLTHPDRFVRWEQLHTDCSGDELAPDADGAFDSAPCFDFHGGRLRFDADWVDGAHESFGSASGFLPQN